jgi:hypothetical protein
MRRYPALLATASALVAVGGCGGGDDNLVEEAELRDCLAEQGLTIEAPDPGSSAGLGSVSPDFRAVSEDDVGLEVVVQRDEKKAQRNAADLQGALASFGAQGSVVVSERNAIVIFETAPPGELRASVEDCLTS